MEDMSKPINKIMEIALRCREKAPKANYKCQICKDTGREIIEQINAAPIIRECKCQKNNILREQWINSGFNIMSASKSFNNFKAENVVAEKMKSIGIDYVKNFEGIQFQSNNGIAFLGQPGAGKTHICMAICLELIKKGFKPKYFPYREEITNLKQNVINGSEYQEKIARYKKCNILLIDDLFKGGANESDIRIMFEILNYRYLNKLPIIISSEILSANLLEIDEALGSRIIEMCKGRTLDIQGSQFNHRLS
jgi:DNA replication protein DnaC